MSNDKQFILNNQIRSKAGKARAQKLSPERRREIAVKANQSRKCMQKFPKATHSGELNIGSSNISCAVLSDGRRVITETSMYEILGKCRGGREKGADLPRFLSTNNLKPFIPNSLKEGQKIIEFIGKTGRKSYGYDATLIPEICKIFLDARQMNILTPNQLSTAIQAEIILHSLAKVGITALIDEATGFEKYKENNELKKLFEKWISEELHPWTRRFPSLFFDNLKKIYGLSHLNGNPQFGGHFINRYIYREISPEVLQELKIKNPSENGKRKHAHHQWLTEDVGHPALDKQIVKINTIMSICDTKEEFDKLFEKSKLSNMENE